MPYFHATRRDNLASIRRLGLGGVDPGAQSEPCERGVYLGSDPRLCLAMMLMHYLNAGAKGAAAGPADEVKQWVVLVVDDARIDARRLAPDPQVSGWTGSWLYRGVIDMPAVVVLSPEQVLDPGAATLPPTTDSAWLGF